MYKQVVFLIPQNYEDTVFFIIINLLWFNGILDLLHMALVRSFMYTDFCKAKWKKSNQKNREK